MSKLHCAWCGAEEPPRILHILVKVPSEVFPRRYTLPSCDTCLADEPAVLERFRDMLNQDAGDWPEFQQPVTQEATRG